MAEVDHDDDAAMSPDADVRERSLYCLDEHLRHGQVLHAAAPGNIGGGGHRDKMIVTLEGGVSALAKIGAQPTDLEQAKREVAAVIVARTLRWGDLLPATVMREVRGPAGDIVHAAIAVWWQDTTPGGQGSFDEDQMLRAATFDALIGHEDRHSGNWLEAPSTPGEKRLVLIDHGHSMNHPAPWSVNSEWYRQLEGVAIPDDRRADLAAFADRPKHGSLTDLIGEEIVEVLVWRARKLADEGRVHDPGTP